MNSELPLGFGMALAQDEAAMHRFETLTQAEKQSVLQQAHNVHSKSEMRQLVSQLGQGGAERYNQTT